MIKFDEMKFLPKPKDNQLVIVLYGVNPYEAAAGFAEALSHSNPGYSPETVELPGLEKNPPEKTDNQEVLENADESIPVLKDAPFAGRTPEEAISGAGELGYYAAYKAFRDKSSGQALRTAAFEALKTYMGEFIPRGTLEDDEVSRRMELMSRAGLVPAETYEASDATKRRDFVLKVLGHLYKQVKNKTKAA